MLAIECRESRIDKRLSSGYLDRRAHSLEEALAIIERPSAARQPVSVGAVRQRGGGAARAAAARRAARCRHRPDLGARPGQRLPADRLDGGAVGRTCAHAIRSASLRRRATRWCRTCEACSRSKRMGLPVFDYGNNIRQVAFDEGVKDAFDLPGLRAGVHPAAVLPRHGAVSLGGAVGRPGGHLPHRRQGEAAAARRPAPAPLARHGARAHPVPGAAGAHLLGRPGRPASARPGVQRDGGARAS